MNARTSRLLRKVVPSVNLRAAKHAYRSAPHTQKRRERAMLEMVLAEKRRRRE
jgi:hypothetical protein